MKIFKIASAEALQNARQNGVFAGAAIDLRDGYIHFSTAAQVVETARLHFHAAADLVLLAVEADVLGAALRWEPSRGGQLFPHLYGSLPMDLVLWAKPLAWDGTAHCFPPETFA